MNRFSVTILGSNSALPSLSRYPTAQVVTMNDQLFLVDCGEGTQLRLRKYGIKMGRINHIFISHLHGDHIFGLPGLISSLTLFGKKGELHIYAHSELAPMLEGIMKYTHATEQLKLIYHPLNFRRRALVYEDKRIRIESFPLKHRISCCGFLFTEVINERHLRRSALSEFDIPVTKRQQIKMGADLELPDGSVLPNDWLTEPVAPPRKYAFCTDTIYLEKLAPILEGVDLLYHEATFAHDLLPLAIKTHHTTALQAGELAAKAGVKKLIIGHYSSRYQDVTALVQEARTKFPETYPVSDGDTFEL